MSWSKEALVDRQVKEWLAKKQARHERAGNRPFHRVLTITGEYGALGDKVGEVVAQQLGFRYYDREIIQMISERAKVDAYLIEQVETEKQSYLQEIFETLLGNQTLNDSGYIRRLTEVVGAIGLEGSAVIMGRGANVILGEERALRVRCIAPRELRIQRNSKRLCVHQKEAAIQTAKEDSRRAEWVENLLGVDSTNPSQYDLVISTGRFAIDQAAALIVRSYRAIEGDKRGLPVKQLRKKMPQTQQHSVANLWMKAK